MAKAVRGPGFKEPYARSKRSGASVSSTANTATSSRSWPLRRPRTGAWRRLLREDFGGAGSFFIARAMDELGRVVVVLEDLLVVVGLPVDEDAADDHQVFALVLGDHAGLDAVGDGLGHRVLGRAEHLHGLLGPLDRDLRDQHGGRLDRQVGRQDGQQVAVPGALIGERVGERDSDRPRLVADQQIDMGDLVAFTASASPMYIDMLPFSSNGFLRTSGGLQTGGGFRWTRTRSSRRDRSSGDRDRQSATAFVRLAPHVITRREAEFQFARRADVARPADAHDAVEKLQSMPDERLMIFGASTRAAAQSAVRAGFRPVCADHFADQDLYELAEVLPLSRYPARARRRRRRRNPVRCPGCTRERWRITTRCSRSLPRCGTLYGNPADVVARVRESRSPWHAF